MKARARPDWRQPQPKRQHAETADGQAPFSPWLRYGAIIALIVSLFSMSQAIAQSVAQGYRVSVPVSFVPNDPQLWAAAHAGSYQAAAAIDPTLPDPNAADIVYAGNGAALTPLQVKDQAFVGPSAARYLFRGATASDTSRALQCLTTAIYYEAASESDDGMRGVAQVILNRVRHPSFPSTICGVVFQGSERTTGCQFSFACDGAMARRQAMAEWQRSRRIAAEALSGRVFPSVGLATHYHTQAVWPYWGKTLVMTNVIGAHIFHRWRGRWGEVAAFRQPYSGREPIPGPHRPIAEQIAGNPTAASTAGLPVTLDPAIAKAIADAKSSATAPVTTSEYGQTPIVDYTSGARDSATAAKAGSVPQPRRDYVDPALDKSGEVQDAFKDSGSLIIK